jgi:DNA-binding transcriptional LysR family regulator
MRTPAGQLELADIDLLLSVQRLGSLGKAAREHQLSQPAVSARIQAVERRLGLRLLERSPSGSRLTPAGTTVATWGQAVVDAVAELLVRTAALRDAEDGLLRVSAGRTSGDHLVPGWLAALRTRLPDLTVEVRVENSHRAAQCVSDGEVDVGVVGDPCPHDDLQQCTLAADELCVIVAPSHPWTGRRSPLTRAELADGVLVMRERGSGTRETVERALGGRCGRAPHLELASTTAIKEAVASGAGAAVVSTCAVRQELRDGELVAVPVTGVDLRRTLRAVWRRGEELSNAATTFLRLATAMQTASRRVRPRHLQAVTSIACDDPEHCPYAECGRCPAVVDEVRA